MISYLFMYEHMFAFVFFFKLPHEDIIFFFLKLMLQTVRILFFHYFFGLTNFVNINRYDEENNIYNIF